MVSTTWTGGSIYSVHLNIKRRLHSGKKTSPKLFWQHGLRPGHAAEVAVVFPARRLRHGVVMPRTSCPRLTRESPHQLAVPHVSWRQPRTRNTTLGGRPTAARIHRTARVNMCIQISPIESPLVGHVTAGRAASETGCMPTPLQRDAGTIPS